MQPPQILWSTSGVHVVQEEKGLDSYAAQLEQQCRDHDQKRTFG